MNGRRSTSMTRLLKTLRVVGTALFSMLSMGAALGADSPRPRLADYRAELARFRAEFGGARTLPAAEFFLFGMGLRTKWLYQAGALVNAQSSEVFRRWQVGEAIVLPADYTVEVRAADGRNVRIVETAEGVFLEEEKREPLPGTTAPVRLPAFGEFKYPAVMRVLHQELLVNVTTNGPAPNFFVYSKPWYRDSAMTALALKETGNLDCIRHWILGLHEVFAGLSPAYARQKIAAPHTWHAAEVFLYLNSLKK